MIAQNINKAFNKEIKHFDFILCDGNFCMKIRLLVRLNWKTIEIIFIFYEICNACQIM